MITIEQYTFERKNAWDKVVQSSRNGTFLLTRDYIEYHSHRFKDHSVLALKNNEVIAVLPANISGSELQSHQGLTYGGWIVSEKISMQDVLEMMLQLCDYLEALNITTVIYKPVPVYFHSFPFQDDLFALSLLQSTLTRLDTSYVIDYSHPFNFQDRKMRNIKKAEKSGVRKEINGSLEKFWNDVLTPSLHQKFGTKPVHSLEEIKKLQALFPGNIIQCNALIGDEMIAGATMYVNNNCVHSQYIASTDVGKDTGAIDYLFHTMITEKFNSKKYFSFGTANNSGNDLNHGLAEWKAGWGAYTVPHFFFRFQTNNTDKLKKLVNNQDV